jgi:N-acyl-D-aspartate/D-glutamate deacylase
LRSRAIRFLDLPLDEDLQTCFIAIDRNNDPKTQSTASARNMLSSAPATRGRPHTADQHETSTNLLGHWVREQQVMTLEEAVHRLTAKTALMHDITDRRFYRGGQDRRHHNLRPRLDRFYTARGGRHRPRDRQ